MKCVIFCPLFSADGDTPVKGSQSNHKKLGTAGLALHYANIITQIDTLVSLFAFAVKFFVALLLYSLLFSSSISTCCCHSNRGENHEKIPLWPYETTFNGIFKIPIEAYFSNGILTA